VDVNSLVIRTELKLQERAGQRLVVAPRAYVHTGKSIAAERTIKRQAVDQVRTRIATTDIGHLTRGENARLIAVAGGVFQIEEATNDLAVHQLDFTLRISELAGSNTLSSTVDQDIRQYRVSIVGQDDGTGKRAAEGQGTVGLSGQRVDVELKHRRRPRRRCALRRQPG